MQWSSKIAFNLYLHIEKKTALELAFMNSKMEVVSFLRHLTKKTIEYYNIYKKGVTYIFIEEKKIELT